MQKHRWIAQMWQWMGEARWKRIHSTKSVCACVFIFLMLKNRQTKPKVIEVRILVSLEHQELAERDYEGASRAQEMFFMLIWLHKNLYTNFNCILNICAVHCIYNLIENLKNKKEREWWTQDSGRWPHWSGEGLGWEDIRLDTGPCEVSHLILGWWIHKRLYDYFKKTN